MVLARDLHRTRAELLYGSGAFRPLSGAEWTDWVALYDLEAKERKLAEQKASKRGRGKVAGEGPPRPRTLKSGGEGED